jgi:hypothetical protein
MKPAKDSKDFPHRRKKLRPYGRAQTPFDPRTGTYIPVGDPRLVLEFEVLAVGDDMLLCTYRDGTPVQVAKPWAFRKSAFDGQTIDGSSYTWVDSSNRTVDNDDGTTSQNLSSTWAVGEKILAAKLLDYVECVVDGDLDDVDDGTYQVFFEDLNTGGRRWTLGGGLYGQWWTEDAQAFAYDTYATLAMERGPVNETGFVREETGYGGHHIRCTEELDGAVILVNAGLAILGSHHPMTISADIWTINGLEPYAEVADHPGYAEIEVPGHHDVVDPVDAENPDHAHWQGGSNSRNIISLTRVYRVRANQTFELEFKWSSSSSPGGNKDLFGLDQKSNYISLTRLA